MKLNLETIPRGTICNVLIKGQRNIRRRVFKWPEMRFGEIRCYLFSAPCARDVRAEYDPHEKSLTISGKRVPASEVSVPHYDLLLCEPYRNLPEPAPAQRDILTEAVC